MHGFKKKTSSMSLHEDVQEAVLGIQIWDRIRIRMIRMFLGLPDPDPLVRGMNP
jgi:hypothetical protein